MLRRRPPKRRLFTINSRTSGDLKQHARTDLIVGPGVLSGLTVPLWQANMDGLQMARPLMNRSRYLAGALALTLALVSSATCLAAVIQMPDGQHHACCAAMADDCGSAATVNADCCADETAALAPAVPFTVVPAVISTALWPPSAVPPLTSAAFDSEAVHPIGPPAYLLDSVFRI